MSDPIREGITRDMIDEELKRGGYIAKPSDPKIAATAFYCDGKMCGRVLNSYFDISAKAPTMEDKKYLLYNANNREFVYKQDLARYNNEPTNVMPGTRQELWDFMNKSAGSGGGPIPDALRRCLICMYRAYRNVYHRIGFNVLWPDDDVPDDFSNLSDRPDPPVRAKISKKAASPVKPKSPVRPKKAASPVKPKTPIFNPKFAYSHLSDKYFTWRVSLINLEKMNHHYENFVRSGIKSQYFSIFLPSEKVFINLSKTFLTRSFLTYDKLDVPGHQLENVLKCAIGVAPDFYGTKKNGIFTCEYFENGLASVRKCEFDAEGVLRISGIKVLQHEVIQGGDTPVHVYYINGCLFTKKIQEAAEADAE